MKQLDQADIASLQAAFHHAAPSLPVGTRRQVEAALRQASLRLTMPLEQWHMVTGALALARQSGESDARGQRPDAPGRAQAVRKAEKKKRAADTARITQALSRGEQPAPAHEEHVVLAQMTRIK